jgi:hypothetical protein
MKYWHAAVKLNLTIAELWHMTVAADPFHDLQMSLMLELQRRREEAERDAALMKLKLPPAEILAIWERSVERLRWVAKQRPERAPEIEADIDSSRGQLIRLRERLTARTAEAGQARQSG